MPEIANERPKTAAFSAELGPIASDGAFAKRNRLPPSGNPLPLCRVGFAQRLMICYYLGHCKQPRPVVKLESRRTAQRLLCCLPLCIGVFAMHSALAISPQQIEATLTELVQQHHGSNRTQVELAPMPPYLQRAQCADLAVVPRTSSFAGNVPIALRCAHPKPWSAYLSARVTVWREVLTACRSLARNETLVSADLCLQEQPSNALRQHPLHSASEAVGMAPKRAINAGSVLYRTQLAPAVTVARGDQVSIEARRGQVLIQAVGKALDAR